MPASFHFGLQPLLELRKRIEETKQQAYTVRRRELAERLNEMGRLNAALRSATKELARAESLAYLDGAIGAQRRRIAELEAPLESARQELIAASRERRVVEKLLERRRRAYEAERSRREERELDEANRRNRNA